jgi:hypothetical protein
MHWVKPFFTLKRNRRDIHDLALADDKMDEF